MNYQIRDWKRRLFITGSVLVLALGVVAFPTWARTYTVNTLRDYANPKDDGYCTLREAIEAANNAPTTDDCGPGSPFDDIIVFSVSGTIEWYHWWGGFTIQTASSVGKLIIDGTGQTITIKNTGLYSGPFFVDSGGHLTLENLTIEKPYVSQEAGSVISNLGTLSIINVNISNSYGSGFATNPCLISNTGSQATTTITKSTFLSNSGCVVYNVNNGTVTITGSIFSDNSGVTIKNSSGVTSIINSTFSSNGCYSGWCRVIENVSGIVNILHTTISGTKTYAPWGAIYNHSGTVNIKNSIVANTIPEGRDCYNNGIFNAQGVNFSTDGSCPSFTQVTPNQLNLGPLADNGGSTLTHALLVGSIAIDSAPDCTFFDGTTLVIDDQRGINRPQGSHCDAGAYEAELFTLAVTKSGAGSGIVTSDPAGIDCGSDCSEVYPFNTVVNLTATPEVGTEFAGWSGDADCADGIVTMDANKVCTATFTLIQHTLTVNIAGTGSGTVTSSPPGINCPNDCTEGYAYGTNVTFTAVPNASSTFAGWSGDPDCTDGQVTMNASKTCTATFNSVPLCQGVTATSSPQRVTFRRANQQATIQVKIRNNSGATRTVTAITPQAGEPFTIVRISPSLPRTINNRSSRTFTVTVRGPAAGPFPVVAIRPYFDTVLDCGTLTTAAEPRLLVPLRVAGIQTELQGDHVLVEAHGEGIASVQLQLFDLSGKQLLNQASNTTTLMLPIRDSTGQLLANGIYLYVVRVRGYDGREYVSEVHKLVILL